MGIILDGRQVQAALAHDAMPALRRQPTSISTTDDPDIITLWHPMLGLLQPVQELVEEEGWQPRAPTALMIENPWKHAWAAKSAPQQCD